MSKWSFSVALLTAASVLVGCGELSETASPSAAGSSETTARNRPISSEFDSATVAAPSPSTASSNSSVEPSDSPIAGTAHRYGSPEEGFTVRGAPVGLTETEVPLTEFVGPQGEFVVSKRFTGSWLDSQINITRSTNVDVAALIVDFERAVDEDVAATKRVFVGESETPGFLYTDALSEWRGLMWALSDTSVVYVMTSGLSDEETLEVARAVEVQQ